MPLADHLREARNRLFIAAGFYIACAIGAAFVWRPVYSKLIEPVDRYAAQKGAATNFGNVTSPLDLYIQGSLVLGLIFAMPFILYQVWAYLRPGLTKKEKRYVLGFFFAAVPLFLAGVGVAYLIFPHAVQAMFAFTPEGSSNLLNAPDFILFVLRLHLAFGIAFLVPLVLVGLNMMGILSGKQVIKAWRIVVFICVLFAAIAAPGPDLFPMFALAAPMLLLFFFAVLICLLNDRRRAKKIASLPDPTETRPLEDIR